jgi:signal transduction histidine kinase
MTNTKKTAGSKASIKAKGTARSKGVEQATATARLPKESEQRIAALTETNRQLKRKIFDLYTIFEISRNFNSVLEYQRLLDSFILTSLAQVGAARGAIFLKEDGQTDRFVMAKSKGSGQMPGPRLFFEAGSKLLEYLSKLNRPVITKELMTDLAKENERTILEIFHPGLIVPLIYQIRLSGLLLISDKISGQEFHRDDMEFLSILGNQISVAIENARLYDAEKKATEQLRAAQQQLVDSERLAALGEMSARVAHEINNPLGIIKNYLLLIKRSAHDNVQGRNYTDVVSQEISRIARIVKELLDSHRPGGMALQQIDVASVINEVLLLMGQQLEKRRVKTVRRFDPNCPQVEASPEHLKQVFLNLIINASDAMPDGGTLEISVETIEDEVSIRFNDTGPGIPADVIPHIFEPFFTTKEAGGGSGLGLSVCYGIVKKHRGAITYRNTDSGGCFEILLPTGSERQEDD